MHSKRLVVILLLSFVVLSGCSGVKFAPSSPNQTEVVRGFAGPGTRIEAVPTGALLLSNKDKNRDKLVCEAFFSKLKEASATMPSTRQIITYWLTNVSVGEAQNDVGNCDKLLQNYDYARAKEKLKEINLENAVARSSICCI